MASLLFGSSLGVIFSVVMVGLAAISILYSTSNVMSHHRTTDQRVVATLFTASALLLCYVLKVVPVPLERRPRGRVLARVVKAFAQLSGTRCKIAAVWRR